MKPTRPRSALGRSIHPLDIRPAGEVVVKFSVLSYEPVFRLDELDRRMGVAKALGYRGIELVATHPLGYSTDEVIALTERHQLPVVSLLSGWSYANEGLCLSAPTRRAARPRSRNG